MNWVTFSGLSRFCLSSFRTQVEAKREAELCHTLILFNVPFVSEKQFSTLLSKNRDFQVFSLHLSSNFHRGFVQKLSWQRTSSKRCYWNWRLSEVRIKTRDFCFIFIYCAESCSPFLSSELEKKAGGENVLAAPKFLAAPSGGGNLSPA